MQDDTQVVLNTHSSLGEFSVHRFRQQSKIDGKLSIARGTQKYSEQQVRRLTLAPAGDSPAVAEEQHYSAAQYDNHRDRCRKKGLDQDPGSDFGFFHFGTRENFRHRNAIERQQRAGHTDPSQIPDLLGGF